MILEVLNSCLEGLESAPNLPVAMLWAGVLGGATHCASQCGVFVVATSSLNAHRTDPFLSRLTGAPLLPFHLGRMTTYLVIALLLAISFGATTLADAAYFQPFILALAGMLFLAGALNIKAVTLPQPLQPVADKLVPLVRPGSFGHGMTMGMMPCPMSLAAIIAAASAPSLASSFWSILAFGVGTSLSLGLVAQVITFVLTVLKPPRWARQSLTATCGFILLFLAFTLTQQGVLHG